LGYYFAARAERSIKGTGGGIAGQFQACAALPSYDQFAIRL
jgi:hypothetical protein